MYEALVLKADVAWHNQYSEHNIRAKGTKCQSIKDIKYSVKLGIAPEMLNWRSKYHQENAEAHEKAPQGICHEDQEKVLAFVGVS
jgi:hypothetical protein